jgi:hypothetical protein
LLAPRGDECPDALCVVIHLPQLVRRRTQRLFGTVP